MKVSIVVPTLGRDELLRQLLGALDRMIIPAGVAAEVVVVDNSTDGSAALTVTTRSGEIAIPVRYVHEPRRGLSSARNAGLAAAVDADAAVFIDDDEEPSPEWLEELLNCQRTYDADAVAGPVERIFAAPTAPWRRTMRAFVSEPHVTGDKVRMAATSNLLVMQGSLRRLGTTEFADRFNLTGGEDSDFTLRLTRAGGTIVWSSEALVYESVPAERTTLKWICRRAFRAGNTAATLAIAARGPQAVTRLRYVAMGSVRVVVACGWVVARAARLRDPGPPIWLAFRGIGMAAGGLSMEYEAYASAGASGVSE